MITNQKKMGIGVVVAIICAIVFYFFYWVKTPAYSLNIIKESIQKHDVATFEKHVDMDILYAKAFDDAIVAMDKIKGEDSLSNPFAVGILQMLKPPVIAALKNETIEFIKGNKDNEETKAQDANRANSMAKGMKSRADIENSALKDVSVISKESNEAIVALKLYNKKVGQDFDLKVRMSKLDDGTWKLKEITNLVEFLVDVDKAEKEKLEELNKPIREELKKTIYKIRNVIFDNTPYQWNLNLEIECENTTDKDISELYVMIYFINDENKIYKEKRKRYNYKKDDILGAHTKRSYNEYMELINTSDKDKVLLDDIADNNKNVMLKAKVTRIKYADGTEVKLLEALPEETNK